MKLTIKTLKQNQFQLDVDGSETVLAVKQKIEQSEGHPVAQQKLIFSGKILADDKKLEEYNISEKDFLVIMVAKPKATPAASSTASPAKPAEPADATGSTEQKKPEESTPAPAPVKEEPKPEVKTEATEASAPRTDGGVNQLVTGAQYEQVIMNMMEMGFERDQVKRALRASFNNPDRAVEYLFNGIPEHLLAEEQQQSEQQARSPQQAASPNAAPASGDQPQNLFQAAQLAQQQQQQQQQADAAGSVNFGQFANTPHFQQLRQLVQTNPALLQPLLQQIGQSNPDLLRLINADPQGFLQALMEGTEGAEDEEGGMPPGSHVIQVTPEEQEAIQRLEALGFPRQAVIEAYLACDKNEELAANYLFDNAHSDDFQ
ncbi:hypothetical protein VTP01DRAFT_10897 [Rhizomucor pusillus]|uniref:uncharacterized protein n=1 Tax=Rhizomucor pusillus TaxID=4840 RepID=UPI003743417B